MGDTTTHDGGHHDPRWGTSRSMMGNATPHDGEAQHSSMGSPRITMGEGASVALRASIVAWGARSHGWGTGFTLVRTAFVIVVIATTRRAATRARRRRSRRIAGRSP